MNISIAVLVSGITITIGIVTFFILSIINSEVFERLGFDDKESISLDDLEFKNYYSFKKRDDSNDISR